MATIVLGSVGAAIGSGIGGEVLGMSTAVIGRAVGASLGRALDQTLLGAGSAAVETGRIERFRLTGASEGVPVAQLYGRMRVAGQVIWATRFLESSTTTGGGKGGPPKPKTTTFSYSVSLAIALCEGEISRVGRIWADGIELLRDDLNLRVYSGSEDQMPDPKIEAVEGAGNAPAYRGIAYVVMEDLALEQFGNRLPMFTFEVLRPSQDWIKDADLEMRNSVRGVAMVPGTGEYALATTPVHFTLGMGKNRSVNVNSPTGKTDFLSSVDALEEELPNCVSVSLVVSWFGDDLRCGTCSIQPKVEQKMQDSAGMPWRVSSVTRATAKALPTRNERPVYGGTPTDQSVVEAIKHLNSIDQNIVFYPFILMEQLEENGLPDPWSGDADQPVLPWRGRLTLSVAPGRAGSSDGTTAAEDEVSAFFGTAAPQDFVVNASDVHYTGPTEWSYRRFVLHYAHLCTVSGGVDAFCIGSELRGLTQIRGASDSFPVVQALRQLASDVRSILGPETKIGYTADWSEYFGYHPQDGSGDVFFHLDPLWADPNIDFIGIDNYMPLSDWRDGSEHLDAKWGAVYNLDYLEENVAGGEGFDWFYHSPEARDAQIRTEITDGAYDEPWVFRYKDLKSWWSNEHYERFGGVRAATPTNWAPGSKPIWFTEFGCAAVDKGSNQPNKFVDPKSSESGLPYFSDGRRDELMQMQYLSAMYRFWGKSENNPVSDEFGVQMLDLSRAHVWAWDARPYPYFPNNQDLWSDGENYARGHWINGRPAARSLASVVSEICIRSGVKAFDTSEVFGYVRGYETDGAGNARSALQPLMLAFGFDAVEREGTLFFRSRDGQAETLLDPDLRAVTGEQNQRVQVSRAPSAEVAGRVRLNFVEADGDYAVRATEAIFPDETTYGVSQSELPIALTQAEGRAIAQRWLAESRVARDGIRFALPPSTLSIGAGDVVQLTGEADGAKFRIDHVEQSGVQIVEAVRVDPGVYQPGESIDESPVVRPFTPAVPAYPVFMDLPLAADSETQHAPYLAVTATPWPGSIGVYSSTSDSGYTLNSLILGSATIGETLTSLDWARSGLKDQGGPLRVRLSSGALSSANWLDVLNGANFAAIGDGSSDTWEMFQFEKAELVEPSTYDLSGRLRGQFGTDAMLPAAWPVGSIFVLLDGVPKQVELASSARDLARHYRIGPASRSYDDPSYVHLVHAFKGVGLRPYSPVHLRAEYDPSDALQVQWVRRTRIDGDSWSSLDVPVGEGTETYLIQVRAGGNVVREAQISSPNWSYTQALRLSDGISGPYEVHVAQLSERFGPGPFAVVSLQA